MSRNLQGKASRLSLTMTIASSMCSVRVRIPSVGAFRGADTKISQWDHMEILY